LILWCVGDAAATADAVATADAAATAKICRAASLARDALIASGGLRTYVPVVSMFVFVTLLLAKTLLPPMLPVTLPPVPVRSLSLSVNFMLSCVCQVRRRESKVCCARTPPSALPEVKAT
jgi:hypothetical protein